MNITSGNTTAEPKKSGITRFLKRANEYKELITIILSLILGALWIYEHFATKSQLSEQKCMTNYNVVALHGQLRQIKISEILNENKIFQAELAEKSNIGESGTSRLNKLKIQELELLEELKKINKEVNDSIMFLRNGKCNEL